MMDLEGGERQELVSCRERGEGGGNSWRALPVILHWDWQGGWVWGGVGGHRTVFGRGKDDRLERL